MIIFFPLKQVFYRERLNGYYGVTVFILSNFLSSFPFLVAIAFSTGTITFYMVKFRPEFSHYIYYSLNIYLCISVIESLMMVVASLVPNFLMGIIAGAGIIVRTCLKPLTRCYFFLLLISVIGFEHAELASSSSSLFIVSAGNLHADLWFLPLAGRSSQAILALSNFLSQLWLMGTTGKST